MSLIKLFFAEVFIAGLLSGIAYGEENVVCKETFDYPDKFLPVGWWNEGVHNFIRDSQAHRTGIQLLVMPVFVTLVLIKDSLVHWADAFKFEEFLI